MLERMLVPLDTSETSRGILPYAASLARRLKQTVHLVSVIPDTADVHTFGAEHAASVQTLANQLRSEAQQSLAAAIASFGGLGVSATSEVRAGVAVEQILECAQATHAGLIAMATHGRVGPERWFVGSVADRIVRTSPIPVLLVRPREDGQEAHSEIDEVILPLDGSTLAEAALPHATFLAQTLDVPLVLVRTVDINMLVGGGGTYGADGGIAPELIDALEADAKGYLEETAAKVEASGIRVRQVFSLSSPASEIIELAHASGHGLVIMSTHGRSGFARTMLGSVADRVIRSSEAPVLVVRPKA